MFHASAIQPGKETIDIPIESFAGHTLRETLLMWEGADMRCKIDTGSGWVGYFVGTPELVARIKEKSGNQNVMLVKEALDRPETKPQ